MRRVTRTEFGGAITVLADSFEGKKLNSPNDIAVRSDGSIWFTDPPFQISNYYEGQKAEQELEHQGVYRITPDGELTLAVEDLQGPNGLAFSPDEKTLYVVEGRAKPNRLVWAYEVGQNGTPERQAQARRRAKSWRPRRHRLRRGQPLWCGWGSTGAPEGSPEALDGVMVFNPGGEPIGHIHLPERCANLCFGGLNGSRLFMASSHSLYAVFVNTRGANLL